jgi:hypothetical protein
MTPTDCRIEMSLAPPALPATKRSIGSLIAQADGQSPEVPAFLAVDPLETAADKLSAPTWRVHARRRRVTDDDPTLIRLLHDLAALGAAAGASADFPRLVRGALAADKGRGGEAAVPSDPTALFAGMFDRLAGDRLWATEYEDFVRQVSFADRAELIGFDQALDALRDLVALLGTEGSR